MIRGNQIGTMQFLRGSESEEIKKNFDILQKTEIRTNGMECYMYFRKQKLGEMKWSFVIFQKTEVKGKTNVQP